MSPFRQKPKKWDTDNNDPKYENRGGFQFNVITQTVVNTDEEMPRYFLAETPEKANSVYEKYKNLLNGWAYSYSTSTGLSRSDLFGEALIGLARACRDWDDSRSSDFKTYAIYRIKDSLNEFVRANLATISVPAYIKKANANLLKIKTICSKYNIKWQTIAIDKEQPKQFSKEDWNLCVNFIDNLTNAAIRAGVSYEKFVERVEYIPENSDFSDQTAPEIYERTQQQLEAALVVDKLKEYMDEDELVICNGIMSDKSFKQIGLEMGKSPAWISDKIKKLRDKIIDKVGS